MDAPEPLTPAGCDLRAFRDMPLDIGRFRQSDLVTEEEPEAILAAIMLWGASWHEVPAASVPNNDKWLAKAAGYGRALDAWARVREGALRGFVLCSDGRLYNRTLAQKATIAWESRQQYEWRKAGDRHRKNQRKLPEDQRTEFPDFEDWKAGLTPKYSVGTDDLFHRNDPEIPAENALKGNEGNGNEMSLGGSNDPPRAREFAVPDKSLRAFRQHRVKIKAAMTERAEELIVGKLRKIWDEHGHDPTAVLDQSIVKGWRDVFPLKGEEHGTINRNGSGQRDTGGDGFTRAIDRQLGRGGPDGPA